MRNIENNNNEIYNDIIINEVDIIIIISYLIINISRMDKIIYPNK